MTPAPDLAKLCELALAAAKLRLAYRANPDSRLWDDLLAAKITLRDALADEATVLALLNERDALRNALERARGCIKGLLARTPVRDVAETLAEIDAAIAQREVKTS